jgi:hypothetical protein
MVRLPNALMGGTWAMRRARTEYLPRKLEEDSGEYEQRLRCASLDNFFMRTVNSYLGQVFQKDVAVHEPLGGTSYDPAFFEAFREDVDLAGGSLTAFSRRVFRNGLVDGVSFVAVDHPRLSTRETASGGLEYLAPDGAWRPKTPDADRALNMRPYFVSVKASQVLDAYRDVFGGRVSLRHFRYEELVEEPLDGDGLTRSGARRIVAWWPDRWETWTVGGREGSVMTGSGRNPLGEIPVAVFMPGEPRESLTAYPPLGDLAELNRVYWDATSDHDNRLMRFVRSPAFLARCLGLSDRERVPLGPSRIISTEKPDADLRSVGVDAASAANSASDLDGKRESMREYGLQALKAHVTATISENAAAAAASSLKGWCSAFKDCLENALRLAARWNGWDDGPAVDVNTRFRYGMDLNLLNWLSRSVMPNGPIRPEHMVECYRMMQFNTDEYSLEDILDPGYRKGLEAQAAAAAFLGPGGDGEPDGLAGASPAEPGETRGRPPGELRAAEIQKEMKTAG